jgi:hypothetical protein
MAGKKGLAAELAFLVEWWQEEHQFVLVHDLTSCLSIGDATSFKEVGTEYEAYLHEIKSDPNRKPDRRTVQQLRRQRMAEEALRSGGPLPGVHPGRLVQLDALLRPQGGPLVDVDRMHQSLVATGFPGGGNGGQR